MIKVDERYATAINSSNLKMDTRDGAPIGDVDLCVAVAWSSARLGRSLLRLVSEYGKPIRLQGMSTTDAILLVGKLKSLRDVQRELAIQLKLWGHPQPIDASLSIISWWLVRVCRKCDGRGYEVVPGTARLSAKQCNYCHGTGEAKLPQGDFGKRAANYLDDSIQRARAQSRKALGFLTGR